MSPVFRGFLQGREERGDEEKQSDQGCMGDQGRLPRGSDERAAEEERWKELSGLGKNKHQSLWLTGACHVPAAQRWPLAL